MISRELALRAIALLEREASALYEAHTYRGEWAVDDAEAEAAYHEMIACALELRRNAGE